MRDTSTKESSTNRERVDTSFSSINYSPENICFPRVHQINLNAFLANLDFGLDCRNKDAALMHAAPNKMWKCLHNVIKEQHLILEAVSLIPEPFFNSPSATELRRF